MFITFEGLDGAGKTTIIEHLKDFLKLKFPNQEFVFTREPGGHNLKEAEQIRKIILDPNNNIDPLTEAVLFTASRSIHLHQVIKPALKSNKIVICDRFVDSSLAYQGAGQNIGVDKIKSLNDIVIEENIPNLTFFFDINAEQSRKRLISKEQHLDDRIEKNKLDFFQRVYDCYSNLANQEKRIVKIDANKKIGDVLEEVKDKIIFYIEKWIKENNNVKIFS